VSGLLSRIVAVFANLAEDGLDAGVDAAHHVLKDDEGAYKHLLWLMREEAESTTDAWAGQAYDENLAGKYATVIELLDGRPKTGRYRDSDNGEGPIFWACFYGPLSLVERLVELGADLHATSTGSVLIWYKKGGMQYIPKGCTTLMMAAAGGQSEVVRYLLDQGVPADALARDTDSEKGHTALFMAARGLGNAAIIGMLVEAGADPRWRRSRRAKWQ